MTRVVGGTLHLMLAAVMLMTWQPTVNGKIYTIDIEEIKVPKFEDTSYVVMHQARATKFNRTMLVFNGSGTVLQDFPPDTQVDATCYDQMGSMKYSKIPTTIARGNLCRVLDDDTLFWPDVVAAGNLPARCPFKAGEYWAYNLVIDHNKLPPEMPGKRWRLDITLTHNDKMFFKISFFIYLNRQEYRHPLG